MILQVQKTLQIDWIAFLVINSIDLRTVKIRFSKATQRDYELAFDTAVRLFAMILIKQNMFRPCLTVFRQSQSYVGNMQENCSLFCITIQYVRPEIKLLNGCEVAEKTGLYRKNRAREVMKIILRNFSAGRTKHQHHRIRTRVYFYKQAAPFQTRH